MPGVLVLGIGNPLRGDDGVGWRAASELAPRLAGCSAEALPCYQLTPELAERVAQAQRVIFIDAAIGAEPGLIRCQTVQAEASPRPLSSHHLTPSSLLRYSRELLGVGSDAIQVTMTAQSFGYTEHFSAAVEAAFPELLRTVEILVRGRSQATAPVEPSKFAARRSG